MQPFVVTCITCQSRIRVSNPDLLGSIVNCPGCDSMLEIPNQQPVQPPASPTAAGDADRWQSNDDETRLAPLGTSVGETVDDVGYQHDSLAGDQSSNGAAVHDNSNSGDADGRLDESLDGALPITGDWVSESTRRRSRIMLISILALAGSLLLIALLISSGLFSPDNRVATSQQEETAPAVDLLPGQAADDASLDPAGGEDPSGEPPLDADPDPPPGSTDDQQDPPPGSTDDQQDPPPGPPPVEPQPPLPPPVENPPGLVPDEPAEPATTEDLAAALRTFGPGLSNRPLAPPANGEPLEPGVEPVLVQRAPIPAVDVEAGMNLSLLEFEMSQPLPFQQFVRWLSQISHVPITIDLQALEASEMTLRTPVQLQVGDTTPGGLLQRVLARQSLAIIREPGHLRISWPPAVPASWTTVNYPIVGREGEQLTELAGMIQQLVAPESWQGGGGKGLLKPIMEGITVTQTAAVHVDIRRLLGQLNTTLQAVSENKPPPPSRTQQAVDMLAQPISVNFGRPTPLATILERIAEDSGISIAVDWTVTHPAGWSAASRTTLITDDDPLGEVLLTFLGSMELGFQVIDSQTIEVTTAEYAQQLTQLAIHDVRLRLEESEPADLIVVFQALLAPGEAAMVVDPLSRHLIVRANQLDHFRIQKQLANQP